MNVTFKNLTLTTVLLSLSVSTYASTGAADTAVKGDRSALSFLAQALDTKNDTRARCSAIKSLTAMNDRSSAMEMAGLLSDRDEDVRSCAIRAAGESKNELAADVLLSNVESYQTRTKSRGPYEVDLKARIKAIDSIWALGEIGSPKVTEKLLKYYAESDTIVRINIAISAGKTKADFTNKFLYSLAGDAQETSVVRAAAYEMLEANKAPAPASEVSAAQGMEKGDLIYTGGIFGVPQDWIGDMPVGHAGIFGGTEVRGGKMVVVIYDCVPDNFKPIGGVRKVFSFTNFTHHNMYAFYGNRVSGVRPTEAQRERIIKAAAAKIGHHYSDSHFSQKGPEDFDCVGYTEYAYEAAGLNPTPDDQETGWGWPLTPAEQYAATTANTHRASPIIMPNNGLIVPPQGIIVPYQGIIQGFNGLMGAYGMKGQAELPQVNTTIQPEAVN